MRLSQWLNSYHVYALDLIYEFFHYDPIFSCRLLGSLKYGQGIGLSALVGDVVHHP